MMESFPLQLRFKGARDYLQGGDLHDALCAVLWDAGYQDLAQIDLTFHKISRAGLDARLFERTPDLKPPSDSAGVLQFVSQGKPYAVYLVPSGTVVTEREPYPEEEIVAACEFDLEGKRVRLSSPVRFSNIEALVAMNKALLQRLFPDSGGKWYFTRIQLSRSIWNRPFREMEVALAINMDFVLTRSAITLDGEKAGNIYYSLIK